MPQHIQRKMGVHQRERETETERQHPPTTQERMSSPDVLGTSSIPQHSDIHTRLTYLHVAFVAACVCVCVRYPFQCLAFVCFPLPTPFFSKLCLSLTDSLFSLEVFDVQLHPKRLHSMQVHLETVIFQDWAIQLKWLTHPQGNSNMRRYRRSGENV